MTMESTVSGPDEMLRLGAEFARGAKSGNVFGLVGTLGTGKTHWTKGFLEAIQPEATVTSPTFGIVNEYHDGKPSVYHFDFYRLKSAEELLALGWDEYLEDPAIVICEWADLYPDLMPEQTCWLQFEHKDDGSRYVRTIKKPANLEHRAGH